MSCQLNYGKNVVSELLKDLFDEFKEKQTKEAKFAYQIDKSECGLQVNYMNKKQYFFTSILKFIFH